MHRFDFDSACHRLIEKYKDAGTSPATAAYKGWVWHEHPAVTGLGYMSRKTIHTRTRSPYLDSLDTGDLGLEYEDDATATSPTRSCDIVTCHQYVVHSASFQVPAFYFTMHDANGSPLPLAELIETSLFRRDLAVSTQQTPYSLTQGGSNFPLLSQGEHPTLGTACWYLHPCETPSAVNELMSDEQNAGLSDAEHWIRWLEQWFLLLGTAVDARY
ncbi:hypothetical protein CPB85DRAFT_1292554 [Mucidula mucida]|nr:hypothetical protein CPB85DRAFT_1292554 [Mucidula mucida]